MRSSHYLGLSTRAPAASLHQLSLNLSVGEWLNTENCELDMLAVSASMISQLEFFLLGEILVAVSEVSPSTSSYLQQV